MDMTRVDTKDLKSDYNKANQALELTPFDAQNYSIRWKPESAHL